MEILYKVEGTIWYKDPEAEVQRIQVSLLQKGIPAEMVVKNRHDNSGFGLRFSFYKKGGVDFFTSFPTDFLLMLSFRMILYFGELVIADPYHRESRHVICNGQLISVEC